MEYTNKLNLILPKGTDAYNIEDFNENFQKIDTASKTKPITTTAQDIDEFITSEEAQNIVSGETIIISGQIYMFMGGSSSDKDNYISYSGNSTEEIGNHVKNTQVHLTDAERTKWNTVDPHTKDKTMHITGAERTKWNTIDSALSTTSTNAIQNKAVAAKIAAIETQNSGFESSLEGLNDSLIWSLPTANWGTIVDGYYKQIKTVTKVSNPNPIWGLSPAALLPTAAEETAYSLLLYLTVDGNTLTVYAKTKPAANVSIIIKGVA